MVAWNEASELKNAALGREVSLVSFTKWERKVRYDFWAKLKRFAGKVPFVEDLVAAYYCALDPATPMRVRGMLLAAHRLFHPAGRHHPRHDRRAGLRRRRGAAHRGARPGRLAYYADPSGGSGAGARQGAAG